MKKLPKAQRPNGAIIYSGPSRINGKPVVAIATGLMHASRNTKTGNMVQTWILRSDISPIDAVKTRQDSAICGGCVHRGNEKGRKRSCYVRVEQAPNQIYKAYVDGKYPIATDLPTLGAGRAVRLGAYGDPAAVPVAIWQALVERATLWTGYTHAWRSKRLAGRTGLMRLCQASVDSEAETLEARALGYGTFRVAKIGNTARLKGEIICPASIPDSNVTCAVCSLCDGKSGRAITIEAHGVGARNIS